MARVLAVPVTRAIGARVNVAVVSLLTRFPSCVHA